MAGMKRILRFDGYPSGQHGLILPARDFPRWPPTKSSLSGHMINPLLTKLVRSRWLYIGFVLFCVFNDFDLVSGNAKKPWPIYSHLGQ